MKNNKIILLTGGTSQIAQAIYKKLSSEKVEFIIQVRNQEQFNLAKQSNIKIIEEDLGTFEGIKSFVKKLEQETSRLDVWINCLGENNSANESFDSLSDEKIDSLINVNFSSYVKIMKVALKKMKNSTNANVIQLNSISAMELFRNNSIYAGAKAGTAHFSNSLNVDYIAEKIKFTNIFLGMTNTSLIQKRFGKSNIDINKLLQTEEVADTVKWLLNQPQNACVREIVLTPRGQVGPFVDFHS